MEENKLNQIIKSEEFTLASDIAEISLDSFTNDGIIKEIPIIGTIIKVLNIGNTISDRIFTDKLIHFLKEINDLDQEFILNEIQYIDDSKVYSHKVGVKLLEIINRIESEGKPEIIGRLFKSFLIKKIDYLNFLRLTNIVDKAFYHDLLLIKQYNINGNLYIEVDEDLYNLGLVEHRGIGYWNPSEEQAKEFAMTKCKITEKGVMLCEYGLK